MPLKHALLAVLVAAIWGCNFIFIKIGVEEISPLFLCAVRFLLASVPAIFFIRIPKNSIRIVIIYGLIMFGLQFALMFSGIAAGMTAGMAALLSQTQIFFSILFAVIFLQEMPTRWQIIGGLVAFSGILVVGGNLQGGITLPGFLLVLSATMVWGFGNLITKKMGKINMLAVVVWGSFVAFIPLAIASYILEGREQIIYSWQHLNGMALFSLCYIVYISTWIGYGLWNWLISNYPVSSVVPFTLLIPIFGILSSVWVFGEQFESWKILASCLVVTGLCINLVLPKLLRKKEIIPPAEITAV